MANKIYIIRVVVSIEGEPKTLEALCRAPSKSKALKAVLGGIAQVNVATQDEIVRIVASGSGVIDAITTEQETVNE